jgi:hypothetical protein
LAPRLGNYATEEDWYMADTPAPPHTGDDTGIGPDRESSTGTPRWVKVFGVIAFVVVVLFVVVMLIGGSDHGPGRHTPGGGGSNTSSDTPAGGHTGPPPGFEHGDQQP